MRLIGLVLLFLTATLAYADDPVEHLLQGDFRWKSSPPLVRPVERTDDPCISIKDPTVVRHDGKWHLFCTIRSRTRTHQIEYLNFVDWKDADAAERHILPTCPGYFCAPQVFYFTPTKQWCMVYQIQDAEDPKVLLPVVSISDTLDDPEGWSPPRLLFDAKPKHVSSWIDFWVICDDARAHLFFTSNDGRMWRCDTAIGRFPQGWSQPQVVLKGDIFEASHTYRLKGSPHYLTVIEAIGEKGRRYYKAYLADRLDGDWKPLADTPDKPFASFKNVGGDAGWTTSISHGELLRAGVDEKLEVDTAKFEFLYQGVSDEDRRGRPYGEILWKLGLLTPE
ncbi:Alpha-L-arabinofuranosidase C precursor [Caulifigura coniformis]|uniref:non-reducing end alpha-L-arabinofuranosidase n=1 Tax=Caulifigura coniformis TaxID=2527983 RepID=A0A517SCI3_9PLAN|nr:non-reducing end alpha-L-arabinofuranosidase family hydrolase [Caulifigura coniformis]QDT53841.1 Alpha-L-arabinofuranosidase C precursor [Caulifigura coniformis]